jgi:hypothetical protein
MAIEGASMPEGLLSLTGSVVAGWGDLSQPVLEFTGDITLDSLRMDLPEAGDRPFVAYEQFKLAGLSLDTVQRLIELEELRIVKPVGTLPMGRFMPVKGSDSSEQALAPVEASKTAAAPDADSALNPFAYDTTVGMIRIEQGDVRVLDPSVEPHGQVGLSSLDMTLDGLHLPPGGTLGSPASLSLSGRVQGAAPLIVTGKIAPSLTDLAGSYADLQIRLEQAPLPPFSGYSASVVGRLIASGQMGMEFSVKLEDHRIEADVPVTISQFKLGESVDREGAIKLPLELAVAVLTGLDGQIKPPALPIRGDLSDPSVSVFGIVIHAISNVVINVAASPFKMLGGLFPQGEEVDPSSFAFAPGSTSLPDDSDKKLLALATTLKERPMLGLRLIPVPDEQADTQALRKQTFVEQYLGLLEEDAPRRQDPAQLAPGSEGYQQAILETYRTLHPEAVFDAATLPDPVASDTVDGESERVRRRIRGGTATVVRIPAADPNPQPVSAIPPGDSESSDPSDDADPTETTDPVGPPPVTFDQAEQAILADLALPPEALADLSRQRAEAIRDALAQQHNADPARIQIADAQPPETVTPPTPDGADSDDTHATPATPMLSSPVVRVEVAAAP